jgi:glycosyltransferase involved in cell wall biosynthesis
MKLSVMIITYNHERFIAQAIESVLVQRVNFNYEILVGEDCSIDRTRDIVMDLYRRHPDRIVPHLRNQNLGGPQNLISTLASCRGQYVALLEGDDYWTCEDKLQKQVDFLDAHPDYALCCHRVQILNGTGTGHTGVYPSVAAGPYTVDNLLEVNFITTCSTMFRRKLLGPLPAWLCHETPGDWALFTLIARRGKIWLMDEVMAMYRVHSGGTWSSLPGINQLREMTRMLKTLDKHLEFQHTNTIRRTVTRFHLELARQYLQMAIAARLNSKRLKTGRNLIGWIWNGGLRAVGSRRTLAALAAYTIFGSWYEAILKARRQSLS